MKKVIFVFLLSIMFARIFAQSTLVQNGMNTMFSNDLVDKESNSSSLEKERYTYFTGSDSSVLLNEKFDNTDPLRDFSVFTETNFSIGVSRVNTNHTYFETSLGAYNFNKGKYLPFLDAAIYIGKIIHTKNNEILLFKSGIGLLNRQAAVVDFQGSNFRFHQTFIQIPVLAGFRNSISNNKSDKDYFKAVECYVGLYGSTPFLEKLDLASNLDSPSDFNAGSYLRFGCMTEILFTFLNKSGKGHKFGIKASIDMFPIVKLNNSGSGLYPGYIDFGIFYTVYKGYRKRRNN